MHESARRRRAMQAAGVEGADGLLVTHPADVRYLSGFTGSSGAVGIAGGRAALFTDARYAVQAKEEARGLRVIVDKKNPAVLAVEWMVKNGARVCAFDAEHTTVAGLDNVRKALPVGVRRRFLKASRGMVAGLRERKSEDEVERLRAAASLGCGLFAGLLEHLVAGATEMRVAAQLEYDARVAGADGMSFETIVASGVRSALPHGRASRAKLPRRGFCTLDFGVLLDGYCSDMTRTVHLGKPSAKEWDVYHSVLEAQQAGVAAVRAGVSCGDVDEAARGVLRRDKLDRWFSHSTGHGVGLEIHEGPRIAAKQTQLLESGMVVTIEPGIYLPGEFGVRIEDTVVVTESGCEVLTGASSKAWMQM